MSERPRSTWSTFAPTWMRSVGSPPCAKKIRRNWGNIFLFLMKVGDFVCRYSKRQMNLKRKALIVSSYIHVTQQNLSTHWLLLSFFNLWKNVYCVVLRHSWSPVRFVKYLSQHISEVWIKEHPRSNLDGFALSSVDSDWIVARTFCDKIASNFVEDFKF